MTPRQVTLSQGTIQYHEHGEGQPVVFVHGLLVNGSLWRKVIPGLEGGCRLIVPDWPLGSHRLAMRADADLTPSGLARLVNDFLAALDLEDVTLVGNDTGGAISQIVATEHPQRIGRLILTPCDAFENFLPPMFRLLQWAARAPAALTLALQTLRVGWLRRLPPAYGWLAKWPVEDAVMDGWVRPYLSDPGVRRDTAKVLRGISPRFTLTAAGKLSRFDRPSMIAWAPEDRFFPSAHAERLADIIPDARLEQIDDAYTFVSEDQPERLAQLIADFIGASTEGLAVDARRGLHHGDA